MGLFDTYGNCQLKIGDPYMNSFKIGDKVTIPDGVYIDYGGAVVIVKGIFVAEFTNLITKWGDRINPEEILSGKSEIEKAINAQIRKVEGEKK